MWSVISDQSFKTENPSAHITQHLHLIAEQLLQMEEQENPTLSVYSLKTKINTHGLTFKGEWHLV